MYSAKFFFCVGIIFVIFTSYQNNVGATSLKRVKRDDQTYTTKYDNIDVDGILSSNRLLRNYINCLLDIKPCNTQESKTLRKYLPDAIATGCSKCSPAQKKIAGRVLSELLLKHKDDWDKLTAKYDPDGTFHKMYFDEDEDYSDLEEA
nr:chemosensory protein 1 [Pachyrhinus yasumatsui]